MLCHLKSFQYMNMNIKCQKVRTIFGIEQLEEEVTPNCMPWQILLTIDSRIFYVEILCILRRENSYFQIMDIEKSKMLNLNIYSSWVFWKAGFPFDARFEVTVAQGDLNVKCSETVKVTATYQNSWYARHLQNGRLFGIDGWTGRLYESTLEIRN